MDRLKTEVAEDLYRVEPQAVADALLARLRQQRTSRDRRLSELGQDLYSGCSYPLNLDFVESAKRTSAAPVRTWPIHVRASAQLRAAASAMAHALGGRQTHSS
jgi:hypothetical protein